MKTTGIRKAVAVTLGALVFSGMSYCTYGYVSAEARVTALCAHITPGMTRAEAVAIGEMHDLNGALPESGTGYLVEARTFGRYGCRVDTEEGIVREVAFTFSD